MKHNRWRWRIGAVITALGLAALLPAVSTSAAESAANVQSLVTQAIHNTNTVNTIVHHDQSALVSGRSTLKVTAYGAEDEVQNREQDSETVTVTTPAQSGNLQTIHYTLDIIFIKGYTYYRSSLQKNQWKRQKGSTFTDPFQGKFRRARTTVSPPQGFTVGTYKLVGTSGGQTHVSAVLTAKNTTGTLDLWIASGAKPYVTREVLSAHATQATNGSKGSYNLRTDYGPFNKPVVIQPPIIAGST
jgi:hypothetical protein